MIVMKYLNQIFFILAVIAFLLLLGLVINKAHKSKQQIEEFRFFPWAGRSHHFSVVDKKWRKFYVKADGVGEIRIVSSESGDIVKRFEGNVYTSFYLKEGKYELQTDQDKFGFIRTVYSKV